MSFAACGEANDMQLVLTQEWQNQGDWRACVARDDRAADSTGWGMPHPYNRLSRPAAIHCSRFTILYSLIQEVIP